MSGKSTVQDILDESERLLTAQVARSDPASREAARAKYRTLLDTAIAKFPDHAELVLRAGCAGWEQVAFRRPRLGTLYGS